MTKYEKELTYLKPEDPVQGSEVCKFTGLPFIYTAGHGYLIVPYANDNIDKARDIVKYGYIGALAIYLEEDCEAPAFIDAIAELDPNNANFIFTSRNAEGAHE